MKIQLFANPKDQKLEPKNENKVDPELAKISNETGQVRLQNFGASCYMNSVLQWLLHTPGFVERMKADYDWIRKQKTIIKDQVIMELMSFIEWVSKNTDCQSQLEILYNTICSESSAFEEGKQCDASELLANLLNRFQTYFKQKRNVYDFSSKFVSVIEQKIIPKEWKRPSIIYEKPTSIGLSVSKRGILKFKVIKFDQSYITTSNYCTEFLVESEKDATVGQIKHKLDLNNWIFVILSQDGSSSQ